MKKLIIPLLATVMVVSLTFAGCVPEAAPPVTPPAPLEPILVGVPYPMVGTLAADGQDMIESAIMAVEEINAAGGLLGRTLEIVEADTKEMMAEDVATAAEILMAAGVDVSLCNYAGFTVDVQAFGKYDVPYLRWTDSVFAQNAILEDVDRNWNVYSICPNGEELGPINFRTVSEFLSRDFGYEPPNHKIALLTMDDVWCQDVSAGIRRAMEGTDWEIVVDEGHPTGNTEWGAQLIKIRQENPAVIFHMGYVPLEAATLMRQFLEEPTQSLLYSEHGPGLPEFLELITPDEAEGLLWGSGEYLYGTPEHITYQERYEERWGRVPASSNTYDVVMVWAECVRKVGDPSDYEGIIDALTTYTFELLMGTYKVDKETHVGRSGGEYIPVRVFQVQGGDARKIIYVHDQTANQFPYGADFIVPPWIE